MASSITKLLSAISYKEPADKTTPVAVKVSAGSDTGASALKDTLKEIDEKFKIDPGKDYNLPDSLGLEYLKYDAPDDAGIKELAKAKLTDYYTAQKQNIEQTTQSKQDTLREYLDNLQKAAQQKEQNISELYEDAKKSVAGEALRRGLARSSIALGQMDALERDKIKEMENTRNGLIDESNRLQLEINKLTDEQQSALRNLDITYAAKLAMEIADMTEKRDQKLLEIQKYNNQIAEKERQYLLDKLKTEQDLKLGDYKILESEVKTATELSEALEERRQQLKYEAILDYLSGMSKADAIKMAETDKVIKENLNTYYYRKLLNALEAR